MMTREEYSIWWHTWSEYEYLSEPVSTLVAHIHALHERIDELPEEHRCACAYEDPRANCSTHAPEGYSREK